MIYKMKAELRVSAEFEIEVNGSQDPQDVLMDRLLEEFGSYVNYDIIDTTIEKADCQYTDQQELEDRERDHER